MAIYSYKCPDGHITDKDFPMTVDKPFEVTCLEEMSSSRLCAKPAKRVYSFAGFKI